MMCRGRVSGALIREESLRGTGARAPHLGLGAYRLKGLRV